VISAPLAFSFRSRAIRIALWLTLAVALGALWYRPFVPRAHAIALSLPTGGLLVAARRMRPFARLGHAAIFPAWLDADACPYDRGSNPTTPLLPL
jgi:hypothetical protein